MDKAVEYRIVKIEEDEVNNSNELVVSEYCLTILLNKRKIASLLCTPENLKALTIGFLTTERLITKIQDITYFELDEEKGIAEVETEKKDVYAEKFHSKKVNLKNLEGVNDEGLQDIIDSVDCESVDCKVLVPSKKIYEFMQTDLNYSEVFKKTGGLHCIALCDAENVLLMREDVARHNALDKVIGESIIRNISLKDKIIILSGRVSLEMVLKAAKMQIPIIVAKSAPTNLAIEMAKRLNITLIAFARGRKMNIYTNEQRISLPGK